MPSFLSDGWWLIAIACMAIAAFILGYVIDAIMNDDGFGAIGNAVVIAAGFLTGVVVGQEYGFGDADLVMTAANGLVGSVVAITLLSSIKAGLSRIL